MGACASASPSVDGARAVFPSVDGSRATSPPDDPRAWSLDGGSWAAPQKRTPVSEFAGVYFSCIRGGAGAPRLYAVFDFPEDGIIHLANSQFSLGFGDVTVGLRVTQPAGAPPPTYEAGSCADAHMRDLAPTLLSEGESVNLWALRFTCFHSSLRHGASPPSDPVLRVHSREGEAMFVAEVRRHAPESTALFGPIPTELSEPPEDEVLHVTTAGSPPPKPDRCSALRWDAETGPFVLEFSGVSIADVSPQDEVFFPGRVLHFGCSVPTHVITTAHIRTASSRPRSSTPATGATPL